MSREVQKEAQLKLEKGVFDKSSAEKAHQSLQDEAIESMSSFSAKQNSTKVIDKDIIQNRENYLKGHINTTPEEEAVRDIEADKRFPKDTSLIDSKTQSSESSEKSTNPDPSIKNKTSIN